jgi:hypothetical protein
MTATQLVLGSLQCAVPVLLGAVALGSAACSSSPKAATTTYTGKTSFCHADVTIDKAGAQVTSEASFLTVLKANMSSVRALATYAPPGAVGQGAKALSRAAQSAAASGNANSLNTPSLTADGANVDTYCGVTGNGTPLPADFAQGKGTLFCAAASTINQGTNAATNPAQVLAFLAGHVPLINDYSESSATLPAAIRSDAQTLVSTARTAISTNNPNLLETPAVTNDSLAVQLYCGQNQ